MGNQADIHFKDNGKLKLLIIVGTRPEIIRLSAVITKCRKYFDCILAHTGQNYDYNLNGVFFHDLKLDDPEVYMDAVGDDLGATIGNIINCSYKLMTRLQPDALLILGDTNSCLSAIAAKRLHIPIFHMEAGNRCKDECLPEETNRRIVDIISDVNLAYSEHARKYLHECGLPKERVYVTGSPMAEVLHQNLEEIEASDILEKLGLQPQRYMLLSAHREENIDTEKNFLSLFTAINRLAEKYDMPILYSCHPRSRKRLEASGFQLDRRVIQHEPLGFHDYNHLQMNAFAVEMCIRDSRHTAATKMAASGLPPEVVKQILGHADIATTLNIYTHPDLSLIHICFPPAPPLPFLQGPCFCLSIRFLLPPLCGGAGRHGLPAGRARKAA